MTTGLQNGLGAKVRDKITGVVTDEESVNAREMRDRQPERYEWVANSTPSAREILATKAHVELWDLVPRDGHGEALNAHSDDAALRAALERMVRAGTVTLVEFAQ